MSDREYKDSGGNVVTLDQLVRREPDWASNIIRWYETKLVSCQEQVQLLGIELTQAQTRLGDVLSRLAACRQLALEIAVGVSRPHHAVTNLAKEIEGVIASLQNSSAVEKQEPDKRNIICPKCRGLSNYDAMACFECGYPFVSDKQMSDAEIVRHFVEGLAPGPGEAVYRAKMDGTVPKRYDEAGEELCDYCEKPISGPPGEPV